MTTAAATTISQAAPSTSLPQPERTSKPAPSPIISTLIGTMPCPRAMQPEDAHMSRSSVTAISNSAATSTILALYPTTTALRACLRMRLTRLIRSRIGWELASRRSTVLELVFLASDGYIPCLLEEFIHLLLQSSCPCIHRSGSSISPSHPTSHLHTIPHHHPALYFPHQSLPLRPEQLGCRHMCRVVSVVGRGLVPSLLFVILFLVLCVGIYLCCCYPAVE